MNETVQTSEYRRAKTSQIALATMNAGGAMCFYMLLTYASYEANVGYGVATAVVGVILTATRIFDGVINPIVAVIIDKSHTRFGKIRFWLLTGWAVESLAVMLLFNWCSGKGHGLFLYILLYLLYIIGYTMNAIAGQIIGPVMVNDPKQRPLIGVWGTVYNYFIPMIISVVFTVVLLPRYGNQYTVEMLAACCKVSVGLSLILNLLACVGVSHADKPENFQSVSAAGNDKVKVKDMISLVKSNKPLQAYIMAGSTNKLAQQISGQSIISTMLFGILIGNMQMSTLLNVAAMLPSIVFAIFGAKYAGKHGSKEALTVWTWICIAGNLVFGLFVCFTDMSKITVAIIPTVLFFILILFTNGAKMCVTTATSSMGADVVDYEMARSGKYMPAVVTGTYSFFDKIISSFATVIATGCVALIGFTAKMPQPTDAATPSIKAMTIFLYMGFPILGWICNLIAMKISPLSREKMIEVQSKIASEKEKMKEQVS